MTEIDTAEVLTVSDGKGSDLDPATLSVHADESPWTSAELTAVREELTEELRRGESEIPRLQASIEDVVRDSSSGSGDDTVDSGSKALEREQAMVLLATQRETVFECQEALNRMAEGSYGVCESCAEAIGKARLQAFPRARMCVECKQRQERR